MNPPDNQADYRVTLDDYIAASRLHGRRMLTGRRAVIGFGWLAVLCAMITLGSAERTTAVSDPLYVAIAVGVGIFFALVAWIASIAVTAAIIPRQAGKLFEGMIHLPGPWHVEWNKQHLSFTSARANSEYDWRDFTRIDENANVLILITSGPVMVILPKRDIDKAKLDEIRRMFDARTGD